MSAEEQGTERSNAAIQQPAAIARDPPPAILQHVPFPPKLELKEGSARKQDWETFRQIWDNYEISSMLADHPKRQRTATLLTCFSQSALKVYNGLQLSEDEKFDIDIVLQKMEQACIGSVNETYERYIFHTKLQGTSETIDDFYASLRELSKTCSFGTLTDTLIRDQLVVGVRDNTIRKRLLYEHKLTLEKCLQIARSAEATQTRLSAMDKSDVSVNAVKKYPKGSHTKKKPSTNTSTFKQTASTSNSNKCPYCGSFNNHPRKDCPASGMTCTSCRRRGHFAKMCIKKKHHNADEVEVDDGVFIGAVSSSSDEWRRVIKVDKVDVDFKVDTGADVNILPFKIFVEHFQHKQLFPSDKQLLGPGNSKLQVVGALKVVLNYKDRSVNTVMYVIHGKTALLSRDSSVELGIVSLIGSVQNTIFDGLGKMPNTYKIDLKPNARPFAVHQPRRVPIPLLPKLEDEIQRLLKLGVIKEVNKPTEWCAPIVPVPKPNGKVRLCVDFTQLNENVKRQVHMLPSVDHVLGQIKDASIFSKLDANSGFHQIALHPTSQLLTTFIAPSGRYCYQRLPFGINSGPEIYQKEMHQVLKGLDGVVCLMDDIVVFGANEIEHDKRLAQVFKRLEANGITLNKAKCEFKQSEIEFLGQTVGKDGVKASAEKISAITNLQKPTNITELRRFLGMVNQLTKFVPHLASETDILRGLLKKNSSWLWGPKQEETFQKIKSMIASPQVLSLFDPTKPTTVSADSSAYGLGAVLLQKKGKELRPVAFASKSLTKTEKSYAQIEKEALASAWACSRFQDYLLGLHFTLETDHKPLVPLLSTKTIGELPARIQRMRMRLMRFTYTIIHVPGKYMYTADTLSRAPEEDIHPTDEELQVEIEQYVQAVMTTLPASDRKLEEIRRHQAEDEICKTIKMYCYEGWPAKDTIDGPVKIYWQYQSLLSVENDLLLYGTRIVIPSSLRLQILDIIHDNHQGINKCRSRANQSVWWPGLSRDILDFIKNCKKCTENEKVHAEPLIATEVPEYPWQKVATDLFKFKGDEFLLIVDYFSKFMEVIKLRETTSQEVIRHMMDVFARHGVPQTVISDNGGQYSSEVFSSFAKEWGFSHVTISPGHSSGNGMAERSVQTIKGLLKYASLPNSLLSYHTAELACGYTPTQLLMSRRIRSKIPTINKNLHPKLITQYKENETERKSKAMQQFNRGTISQPPLTQGDRVFIPDRKEEGVVKSQVHKRSYVVKTDTGKFRRNRIQIRNYRDNKDNKDTNSDNSDTSVIANKSVSTPVKPSTVTTPVTPPVVVQKAVTPTPVKQPNTSVKITPRVTRSGRSVIQPARYRND